MSSNGAPTIDRTHSPAMPTTRRSCRCAAVAGAAVAAAAGALYVRALDPATDGWFPSCPLRSLTGIWCPGCGLTRATHHLLNGEVATALRFNLFVVPVLVGLLAVWTGWARSTTGRTPRPIAWSRPWGIVSITVVMGFTVARNIPALGVLRGIPV